MAFKGRNCDICNVDIYINEDLAAQETFADHFGHRISSVDNAILIQAVEAHFWKCFISFWLILGTVIQLSKVNSIVIYFLAPHFGVYMAITALEFVLLEKRSESNLEFTLWTS